MSRGTATLPVRRRLPPDSKAARYATAGLLGVILALLVAVGMACSDSPTEWRGGDATLTTSHGTFAVAIGGLSWDGLAARAAAEQGYEHARRDLGRGADGVSVQGWAIRVVAPPNGSETIPGWRLVSIQERAEFSLAHEIGHVYATEMGLPYWCAERVWHHPGYTLRCEATP